MHSSYHIKGNSTRLKCCYTALLRIPCSAFYNIWCTCVIHIGICLGLPVVRDAVWWHQQWHVSSWCKGIPLLCPRSGDRHQWHLLTPGPAGCVPVLSDRYCMCTASNSFAGQIPSGICEKIQQNSFVSYPCWLGKIISTFDDSMMLHEVMHERNR